MAWSTREIAELAGTSLRAVRHYHEVGLLPEPERHSNGYKQYGVSHLVRLLRIKRLVDLGFSLSQIAAMGDDDHHPAEALRALDAELAATIERLQRARMELGLILRHHAPADLPADIAPVLGAAGMSDADRSLVLVMSRVMGPEQVGAYAEMLHSVPTDPTDVEFDRNDACSRLEGRFRRARDEGDLPPTSDPGLLARFLMTVSSGIAVQAAGGAGRDELHQVADLVLQNWPLA